MALFVILVALKGMPSRFTENILEGLKKSGFIVENANKEISSTVGATCNTHVRATPLIEYHHYRSTNVPVLRTLFFLKL